jgi:hypothetical protein
MSKQLRSIARFFIEVAIFIFATALAFRFFTEVYPLGDGEGVTVIFPYTAAVFVGGILYMMAYAIGGGGAKEVIRGERLRPTWHVKLHSRWRTLFERYPYFWGGAWHSFASAVRSLVVIGATGSGKTLTIRLYEQSTLPWVGRASDHRALCHDASNDYFPRLSGMGIDVSVERGLVRTLNPYDLRAWAWDMGKDIQDYRTIDEIGVILIPVQETGDPFWSNSSRTLLKANMKARIARGEKIDVYEMAEDMRSFDRMRQKIEDSPETRHIVQKILEQGKTTESIDATLYSYMEPYEPIFAIWKKIPPERHMSLTEWLTNKKGSILLLGRAERGTAHDAINRLIVERLGQLITIHLEESSRRRIYINLDEARNLKVRLDPIVTMGRKFGAVLLLGYQDQAGLEDAYNEKVATELFGQCQSRVYCFLGTEKTALYAASDIGKQDYKDEHGNEKERWVVHPNELTSIKHMRETNRRNGLTFFAKSATYGVYKMRIRGRKLFNKMLCPLDPKVPAFIPRPASDQFFYETVANPNDDVSTLGTPAAPLQVETAEAQEERAAADEKARAARSVRERQREARERRNVSATSKSEEMTIQELLRRRVEAEES